MKSISIINPAKYRWHDRESARPSYWYKSGCVALTQCIITLRFAPRSSNIRLPFQAKNNVTSAPASTASLTPKSLCAYRKSSPREKGLEYKREQRWTLVEPWCKHWSCCGWRKGTSPDEATLNGEEIKPVAIAIIKLLLSERISKGVSQ